MVEERVSISTSTQAHSRRPRVVLADDHPDVLDEVRHLLEFEFDVVFAVGDGNALFHAVAESRPDAVISDAQMPGLGGLEAGEQIIRQGLCSAVIVLTMYSDRHLVGKALRAGIRGYVLKVDASDPKKPQVTIGSLGPVKQSLTLEQLKAKKEFKDSALLKQGRLSVVPLTESQWKLLVSAKG